MCCGIDFLPLIGMNFYDMRENATPSTHQKHTVFPSGVWVRAKVEPPPLPHLPPLSIWLGTKRKVLSKIRRSSIANNFLDAGVGPHGVENSMGCVGHVQGCVSYMPCQCLGTQLMTFTFHHRVHHSSRTHYIYCLFPPSSHVFNVLVMLYITIHFDHVGDDSSSNQA